MMEINQRIDGEISGGLIPIEKHKRYDGTYEVTPSIVEQVLETADLIMRENVTIDAIPDTYIDTSDATAETGNILQGETAYVKGEKLTGSMVNRGDIHAVIDDKEDIIEILEGYHNGLGTVEIDEVEKSKIIPENIRKNVKILGVDGTLEFRVELQDKVVHPARVAQEVIADQGKDGLGKVTVEAMDLEDVTVKSTTQDQQISPSAGKDGIGSLLVQGIDLEEKIVKSTHETQEITPSEHKDGISKVYVNPIETEEKTVKSTTAQQEILPNVGKDAISKVIVQPIKTEEKTVKSSKVQQEVFPDIDKDGISKVTVEPIITEEITVKSASNEQVIPLPAGTDGYSKITVEKWELQSKTVDPSDQEQRIEVDKGFDAFDTVTIHAIPANRPDVSDDTAVESDVAQGKIFHKADGTQATGTASSGGGGSDAVIVSAIENDPEGTLMDFNIPASVGTIGQGGLFYCANFVKTIYGENVRVIKGNGIYLCTRLTSVRFGGRVESLEAVQDLPAIGSCFSLTAITGLENIYWLGRGSFDTLSALEYLRIGFKLKPWASGAALSSKGTVGKCIVSTKAFIDFYALKTLCFDASGIDDLTKIEISSSAIFLCDALTNIYVSWPENAVASAPWGANNATIHYNTQFDANGDPIV